MINNEATIRWKGYDPATLGRTSKQRVWAICDDCGKGKWVQKGNHDRRPYYVCKSCSKKGDRCLAETRKKMTKSRTGNKNPMWGKPPSKEHSERLSKSRTGIKNNNFGKPMGFEARKKSSATHQGIHYDEWEDFVMDKTYCPAFDDICRESNRKKYNNECFICGLQESENRTKTGKLRKLSVHHVDMKKEQGCDGHRWKLIPVCMYCHIPIHTSLWQARIIYLLNNIYSGASVHPPVRTVQ